MEAKDLVRHPAAQKLPAAVKDALAAKVIDSLRRNPLAVERAIAVLYARQTADERRDEETRWNNALGVKAGHGGKVAYYGRWIASGRHLTGRHLDSARRLAEAYARTQLMELAAIHAGLVSA